MSSLALVCHDVIGMLIEGPAPAPETRWQDKQRAHLQPARRTRVIIIWSNVTSSQKLAARSTETQERTWLSQEFDHCCAPRLDQEITRARVQALPPNEMLWLQFVLLHFMSTRWTRLR